MKYKTTNEFEHFDFGESYVKDLELGSGYLRLWLDNVKILPENTKNRDIRLMRTNNLLLTVQNMQIRSFVREGVKIYNADGVPTGSRPDEAVDEAGWEEILPLFLEGAVAEFAKEGEGERAVYTFAVDASDEETYAIVWEGTDDMEEWDRFLNIDSM